MHVVCVQRGLIVFFLRQWVTIDTYLYDLSSTLSKSHLVDVYGRGRSNKRKQSSYTRISL